MEKRKAGIKFATKIDNVKTKSGVWQTNVTGVQKDFNCHMANAAIMMVIMT